VSLAETVELARVLGRLPARTVVFGIEAASFAIGEALTPAVAEAAASVAAAVREEVTTGTVIRSR
jgi:hydrogenase maturation protease